MQKKYIYIVFALTMVFLLNSCITARKLNYLQETSINAPMYDSIGYEEYILKPTDKLLVRVYSPDQKINSVFNEGPSNLLSATSGESSDLFSYAVKEDGTIKLPIIGNIEVAGHTIRQAKAKIEKEIKDNMMDDFAVYVKMVDRYFSIIGSQVNGRYQIFRENMNIFQALAMAGDISTFGDRKKIRILRETSEGTKISMFDIRSKDIINSEYYYIQPNDVIYIQDVKSQFFSVTSFGAALSTTLSTISFGIFIYSLTKDIK